jgi:Cache domain
MVEFRYSNWPLGRQLKLNLVSASLLVCLVLILITKYQLDWLRSQMTENYMSLLNSNIKIQMDILCQEEASYIQQEFNNFIETVVRLNKINRMILGFGSIPPFKVDPPVQDTEYSLTDNDYSTGCFMSSYNPLSSAGVLLESLQAGMDKIYPLMNHSNYLYMYSGFEIDEIIHYYPSSYTGNRLYTPIVREWYYSAKDNPESVIITEPYPDDETFIWIVTVSKAILDSQNNFYGVSACDITLEDLTTRTSNYKILENGFTILVSKGGMILTTPKSWNNTKSQAYQIFDESYTGISQDKWLEIKSLNDGNFFYFTRNNTNYIAIKYSIEPYPNSSAVSHYLIACADTDEIIVPANNFYNSYSDHYSLIFILVITVASAVYAIIIVLIHCLSKNLSKKLKEINRIFAKIANRGLSSNITQEVDLNQINTDDSDLKNLISAVKTRVYQTKEAEEKFSYFKWGSTRPKDVFYFCNWTEKLYPINLYNGRTMEWRKSISEIINRAKS